MNGTSFGGQINLPAGATGYREVTTTVTRDTNGVPMTSREYQIEYLNPANTVTVLNDRSSSPAMELLVSFVSHNLLAYISQSTSLTLHLKLNILKWYSPVVSSPN